MASVPTARPPGGGAGPLYGLIFLLALLAGDYYVLTSRDQLHTQHPGKARVVVPAATPKRSPSPAAAGSAKAAPVPGQSLDLLGGLGGGGDMMGGISDKALALGGQAVDMQVGLALRAVLVAVAVGLIFMQSAPPQRVGTPRRVPRNPKEIEVPVLAIGLVLAFSSLLLLGMGIADGQLLSYGYPATAALVIGCGFLAGQLRASTKPVEGRLTAEKVRVETEFGIILNGEGGEFVNIPNPFRGTLVIGGAGAGKTYSIGEPFLEQFLKKGMCGLVYDFKFPVLAAAAQKALIYAGEQKKPVKHRIINFLDLERTEKINPLRPQDMPIPAYAMEYAKTILTNLNPGAAKSSDGFFESSAEAYLTAIIWFYKNNYPNLCTIPHVVATAVYSDFTHVLSMLDTDPRSQQLAQSIITSVKLKADKQTAGIIASLQIALARLATPEISWVLAPDETQGEGFSLDLNDPTNPTLLTIGNDPTLARTFAPVISCIIAVCIKLMNQQNKHPSFVLIDEGATIYVPGLETLPATARSNQVATVYMTQDLAQMNDAYGKDKTAVMVSNLNNQFFGKINSAETARLISDMIGQEDVEQVSVSASKSMGGGQSGNGRNISQSVSVQQRQVIRVQDAYTLRQGEFVCQTVETEKPFVQARFERDIEPGTFAIAPMSHFEEAEGVVTEKIRDVLQQDRQVTEQTIIPLRTAREQEEDARSREGDQRRAAQKAALTARRNQAAQPAAEESTSVEQPAQEKLVAREPADQQPDSRGLVATPAITRPAAPAMPQRVVLPEPTAAERAQLEAVARQLAGEKRLVKAEKVVATTAKGRLVEQNHERIYAEVAHVITSYPNELNPKGDSPEPIKPTY